METVSQRMPISLQLGFFQRDRKAETAQQTRNLHLIGHYELRHRMRLRSPARERRAGVGPWFSRVACHTPQLVWQSAVITHVAPLEAATMCTCCGWPSCLLSAHRDIDARLGILGRSPGEGSSRRGRVCLHIARRPPVIVPTTAMAAPPAPVLSPHSDGFVTHISQNSCQHDSGHHASPNADAVDDVVVAPSKILCAVTML
jgi:hypothetical protein